MAQAYDNVPMNVFDCMIRAIAAIFLMVVTAGPIHLLNSGLFGTLLAGVVSLTIIFFLADI